MSQLILRVWFSYYADQLTAAKIFTQAIIDLCG